MNDDHDGCRMPRAEANITAVQSHGIVTGLPILNPSPLGTQTRSAGSRNPGFASGDMVGVNAR
eukprot:CAMPEP_0117569022 /NCGR_PEP_ID=MMETSP0784-20121206/58444_1 /TAXON_ID=39447 /ORGANISM="" /LENGTH=62 /DNA_ID=CAMNT_0005366983 /DNA_START=67 /DNA_END=255 /DNA_ORIENTATION=-